ncbi:MAG: hypothetical protein ACXVHB_32810 [Solirubrobacteraceae bacterium]
MKRLLGLVTAVLIVLGANTSAALANVSQTFTVPATALPDLSASCGTGPVDTGVNLAANQSAVISGSGAATPYTDQNRLNGPGGDPLLGLLGPYGGSSGGYVGGLIAQAGSSGWISIGTGPTTLAGPGELFLGFDDIINACDNAGSFAASVSVVNSPPNWPHVSGGGKAFAAGRAYTQVAFSVQNGPNGISGHITATWPAASSQPPSDHGVLLATPTCLVEVGNTATMYGRITKAVNTDGFDNLDWIGYYLTDNPDSITGFGGYGPPPWYNQPVFPVPFYSGNIGIH